MQIHCEHLVTKDVKTSGRLTTGYLKKNTGNIGPIRTSLDQLACKESVIANEFRIDFFSGRHLSIQNVDEDQYGFVKRKNEHNDDLFEDEITISELEQALKELPPTGSTGFFDIDNLHIMILKHLGSRAKLAVLHLFNKCWAEGIWPWNISKVIFIRKTKKSYSNCSSFRPLTISSHMRKLMEMIVSKRLTLHRKRNFLIQQKQEHFRPKHSTTRSIYQLHLKMESIKRLKEPSA